MVQNYSAEWIVPAHITGLFQIFQHNDPLYMGSKGAGFSIDNPFFTRAELTKTSNKNIEVFFNDVLIQGNVSSYVAMNFYENWKKKGLRIKHYGKLPMGAGFGASGAGAIGSAFALNELFHTNFDQITLGQFAHQAEVVNRTGLGDVISQMKGGAEIRIQPGAPGIGQILSFDWPKEVKVLSATLGPISTKEVITSEKHIEEINVSSERLLQDLIKKPTIDFFVELSYIFAREVNLMSDRIKKIILLLRDAGYKSSMIMIGESLFVACLNEEIPNCIDIINKTQPGANFWVNSIAEYGPMVILK